MSATNDGSTPKAASSTVPDVFELSRIRSLGVLASRPTAIVPSTATTTASPPATSPAVDGATSRVTLGAWTAESVTSPASPATTSNPASRSTAQVQNPPAWAANAASSSTRAIRAPVAGSSRTSLPGMPRTATWPPVARPISAPAPAASSAASQNDGSSSRRRLTGAVSSQEAAGRGRPSGPSRRMARKISPAATATSDAPARADKFGATGQNTFCSCLCSMPPMTATVSTAK